MNRKYMAVCWMSLTILVTAGLRYVPPYLIEQRKLDQQDRILDFKERLYLKPSGAPTISVPAPLHESIRSQLL